MREREPLFAELKREIDAEIDKIARRERRISLLAVAAGFGVTALAFTLIGMWSGIETGLGFMLGVMTQRSR